MKPLLIALAAGGTISLSPLLPVPSARPIGPCMPYAEKCLNCVDCSACKHCSVKGGKCSVCFKR